MGRMRGPARPTARETASPVEHQHCNGLHEGPEAREFYLSRLDLLPKTQACARSSIRDEHAMIA